MSGSELDPFRADDDSPREKRYALTMFPYPSGDLHMGHAEVFALHDVVARYWWQRGYEVLNPMGFDSFGLPAENAAIRHDEHPDTYTRANIAKSIESCRRYAASFDWSRTFNTSDPEYYRWTQWLFLELFKRGLAYRKNSPVNWCPNDQTVLANEQVVGGVCDRCGAEVTKKNLTQWYFKITDYAQELLDGLDELADTWPDRVVTAQRNWIGRSEGAHVTFALHTAGGERDIEVYTTRPDTLYGATFMVVAADAALAAEIVHPDRAQALEDYLVEVRKASDIDRLSTDRPKTGVDLGITATNPVSGEEIPVWASDYVLADYGTGAIMAVPAPRPARPGLRAGDGAAGAPRHRRARGGRPRGDRRRDVRRRGVRQLRRPGRAGRQGIRHPHDHRAAGGRRARLRGGQLPPARLADQPAALLGTADPDHPLPGGR